MLATSQPTELYHVTKDRMTFRPHPGQAQAWRSKARFTFIIAGTQSGKGIIITSMIPTPNGFIELGNLKVGDMVFGADGLPYPITYISPIHHLPCYKITFNDGSFGIFDNEHLWRVQTRKQRKNMMRRTAINSEWITNRPQCRPTDDYSVITTEDIYKGWSLPPANKNRTKNIYNYSIDLPSPAQYPEKNLPIPPYTFGAWLGDGSSKSAVITCSEDESIIDRIRLEWGTVKKHEHKSRSTSYSLGTHASQAGEFIKNLVGMNVFDNKHIPEIYLTASIDQRLELLRGLLDTDGACDRQGRIEFTSTSNNLANGVFELVRSLGILARIYPGKATLNGRVIGEKWRVYFTTTLPVFTVPRKLERQKAQKTLETSRLFISNVEPVESVPTKCISVDSPNNLYLFGRSYIPTHNTSFLPMWLNREIAEKGHGDYLAVTATYDLYKLKFLPEMRHFFVDLFGWQEDKSDRVFWKAYKPKMFDRIILRSASSEGGLESATVRGAILDECGQDDFRLTAWDAVQRRLSLSEGRVLGATTPYNLGWLKQEIYDRWRAHDPDIRVIQFSSLMNPVFPKAEYYRQKAKQPTWKFSMFYDGVFTRPAGLIYEDFIDAYREEGGHKVHPFDIPPEWPRRVGFDFGPVHTASLWLVQDPDIDIYYLYRETLEGGMTTPQHAEKAKERAAGENVVYWVGGAGSEDQYRMDWAAAGVPVQEPQIKDVEPGIDRVIELWKTKRLFVFDTCKMTLDELGTYSRVVDEFGHTTNEIKDKKSFHLLDGLRYDVIGLDDNGSAVLFGM